MIRQEVVDPQARSTLEVTARAEEAIDLSAYVMEVTTTYSAGNGAIAKALTHVAGDIRKGTDGVNRMRQASDVETAAEVLAELVMDADEDVRWWAAQNPSTPTYALAACLEAEVHHLVIAALLNNPHLPDDDIERFVKHPSPDVKRAANRRLKEMSVGLAAGRSRREPRRGRASALRATCVVRSAATRCLLRLDVEFGRRAS